MNVAGWLNQTVVVASITGRSSYGDPTFGAKNSVSARVQPTQKIIRTSTGEEEETTSVVYTSTAVGYGDRIWLPGVDSNNNTLANVPLRIDTFVNKAGVTSFYKVWL